MKRRTIIIVICFSIFVFRCEPESDNWGNISVGLSNTQSSLMVSGYEVLLAETEPDTTAQKNIEVDCPIGKKALAAGWSVLDTTSAILNGQATYFEPKHDGQGYRVSAINQATYQPIWKLRMRVICADATSLENNWGYEIIESKTKWSTGELQSVNDSCPSGKVVTHSGWSAIRPGHQIIDGLSTLSLPSEDGQNWTHVVQSQELNISKWRLRTRTICIDNTIPGYTILQNQTIASTITSKQIKVQCPENQVSIGAGWRTLDEQDSPIAGQALYNQAAYNGTGWMINARPLVYGFPWKLQARLICID